MTDKMELVWNTLVKVAKDLQPLAHMELLDGLEEDPNNEYQTGTIVKCTRAITRNNNPKEELQIMSDSDGKTYKLNIYFTDKAMTHVKEALEGLGLDDFDNLEDMVNFGYSRLIGQKVRFIGKTGYGGILEAKEVEVIDEKIPDDQTNRIIDW